MKTVDLMRALDTAKASLGPSDSAQPILGHFCFGDDCVYAYNDVTAIVMALHHGVDCGLHGETLLGMLSVIGTEELAFEHGEHSVKFKVANGYMEVPKMHAKDFLFEMPGHIAARLAIPLTAEFLNALDLCLAACDEMNLNPAFAGVTVVNNDAGGITLYATNNETAVRCEVLPGECETKEDVEVVLPVRACVQLLKLAGKDTLLEIGDGIALCEFPDGALFTKLLPADVAMFESVFDKSFDSIADNLEEIPKGMGREVAKAAVVLGKEKEKYCTIGFAKDGMQVNAAGVLGRMETVLKMKCGHVARVLVMVDPILKVLPHVTHFFANDGESIVFANPETGLVQMICSRPMQKEQEKPKPGLKKKKQTEIEEDDIPF